MKIFAYCTATARAAVRAATGVKPRTSPPLTANVFDSQWLTGYDLLYFRLHGHKSFPTLMFGDGQIPALIAGQIRAADLGGAIVVIANCYGTESPLVQAFYAAGASAVIAGYGPNIAAGNRVVGTDLLVKWLIRGLQMRLPVKRALAVAKARLLATSWRAADRDAREFTIMRRKHESEMA